MTLSSAFCAGSEVSLIGEAATGVAIQKSKTSRKRVVVEVVPERRTAVGITNPEAASSSRRVVVQTVSATNFDGDDGKAVVGSNWTGFR